MEAGAELPRFELCLTDEERGTVKKQLARAIVCFQDQLFQQTQQNAGSLCQVRRRAPPRAGYGTRRTDAARRTMQPKGGNGGPLNRAGVPLLQAKRVGRRRRVRCSREPHVRRGARCRGTGAPALPWGVLRRSLLGAPRAPRRVDHVGGRWPLWGSRRKARGAYLPDAARPTGARSARPRVSQPPRAVL